MIKYGLKWPDNTHPLEIERYCIRQGGDAQKLFHHFRALEAILWPDEYVNRWTDWMLRLLCEETICVFGACKDSGKTRRVSKWALMDYWCFPDNTLTVMTSTTNRGLELRVWGDIKSLWQRATDKFPWLEGNPSDSKHGIFTDALNDDVKIRDMRKGIIGVPTMNSEESYDGAALNEFVGIKQARRRLIGDECFPAGTPVETVRGTFPIEQVVPGNKVFCASGVGTVIATNSRLATDLVEVRCQDGRKITCTPNHPFLTQFGWKRACELNEQSYIVSLYESMQLLRQSDLESTFLWKVLHSESLAQRQPTTVAIRCEENENAYSSARVATAFQTERHHESDWSQAQVPWWEWNRAYKGRVTDYEDGSSRDLELWNKDRQVEWQRISACLQSRCGYTQIEARNRGRWFVPYSQRPTRARYEKRQFLKGTWVDRVTLQKQTTFGRTTSGASLGRHRVYNLQVDQHPSYCVHGLLVHNCQYIPADYLKVIYAMNAGDFKGVFLGNMIAENGKTLDKIAEPEGGWGTEGEITKSTQWRNKYGGVTLNMVGTDSPNLDPATKNKFPGMLTQESIDRVAKLPNAKDSVEWWSQILGIRKIGVISDRVLLVSDVKNNGGFNEVIWSSPPQKGLAIDAGFGGDDCVKTVFEYGEEVSGRMVIAFTDQSVYQIAISSPVTPEDQIAVAAKADCEKYDIPYENVFIEAGMRATLAVSFGRILSPAINAINFGGTATDRPVSNDLFVFDEKTQQRRLKTCYEHYSKLVTELAFAVRDLVMCGQARHFPMRAAEEFQKRRWEFVYGDRYELETKVEYKERNASKSPNDSDSVMIAVEGARRLGFQIERANIDAIKPPEISVLDVDGKLVSMPMPYQKPPKNDENWLAKEVEKHNRLRRENELNYQ